VNRRRVTEHPLGKDESRLFKLAMVSMETAVGHHICGYIGWDGTGVFIVPQPGAEMWVLRELASCDWNNLIRQAEEHIE
jgi:hypothetical protein